MLEDLGLHRVRKRSDRQLLEDSDSGTAYFGVHAGALAHCFRDDTCQPVTYSAAAGRIPTRTPRHSPERRTRPRLTR